MKKLGALLAFVLLITSVFAGCSKTAQYTVNTDVNKGETAVVSFNVAAPWGSLTNNTLSSSRVKRFALYMNALKPDIIGTQEMNSAWLEKLGELMSDYDSYGVARGGDENEKKSELNAVFWLKGKYECVDKGTFWLSETPDTESKYQGAGCNRICTYVMLHNINEDKYILHLNTHLDNASDEARLFGAQVIADKISEYRETSSVSDYEIVITGDFNDYIESSACQFFADTYNVAKAQGNTYHEWGNISDGEPIDFVFSTLQVKSTQKLDDISNGYVSDHYGVYAVIG